MEPVELLDGKKKKNNLQQQQLSLEREETRETREPASPKSFKEPVWRSKCCTQEGTVVTKSLLTFTLTSIISVIVLVFSLVMLTYPDLDESMKTLYISLVSSISSLHVPSPLQKMG